MAMGTVTTDDGTVIFYKDWGPRDGRPIVFHHGWPLSADDWDNHMLFFLEHGFRVIAHDHRGRGRSSQTATGNDMDTYASDVAVLTDELDLQGAYHVGHSTGAGEVTRYVARAKAGRVAKAVLVSAIPPVMLKSKSNPGGLPVEAFDELRTALAANRSSSTSMSPRVRCSPRPTSLRISSGSTFPFSSRTAPTTRSSPTPTPRFSRSSCSKTEQDGGTADIPQALGVRGVECVGGDPRHAQFNGP